MQGRAREICVTDLRGLPKEIPVDYYYYFMFNTTVTVTLLISMSSYLTRVPYHVDVSCYLTIQTKLLYLMSGESVLLVSFLLSVAGTSGRFPSGGPKLSFLLHSL